VTHAIILITAERSAFQTLGGELAGLDGVAEVYSVTGDWDFVAIVRVKQHEQIAELVTEKIAALPGVRKTHTMVAFQAFSQFDLEAMFTIGQ
jgi:DNA-binding Lrp family transcriptional regulator